MSAPVRHLAIVPAAGVGQRSGRSGPKQYERLAGLPMLCHALEALARVAAINQVLCVLAPGDAWPDSVEARVLAGRWGARLVFAHAGGPTRAASVLGGLDALAGRADEADWILVHDAARPGLRAAEVESLLAALRDDPVGGLLAMPVADTVKRADADERVAATPSRDGLWLAQTPQMFRLGLLRRAYVAHPDAGDEAGAVEALGLKPRLVRGRTDNFKVTYPEDFALAEALLAARATP
jgi:2-C-methyl-D-erythritol 4-phosphate cytidylyltransferase